MPLDNTFQSMGFLSDKQFILGGTKDYYYHTSNKRGLYAIKYQNG